MRWVAAGVGEGSARGQLQDQSTQAPDAERWPVSSILRGWLGSGGRTTPRCYSASLFSSLRCRRLWDAPFECRRTARTPWDTRGHAMGTRRLRRHQALPRIGPPHLGIWRRLRERSVVDTEDPTCDAHYGFKRPAVTSLPCEEAVLGLEGGPLGEGDAGGREPTWLSSNRGGV